MCESGLPAILSNHWHRASKARTLSRLSYTHKNVAGKTDYQMPFRMQAALRQPAPFELRSALVWETRTQNAPPYP